jgi:DNA-binding GntR family transcriptional regulator
LPLAVERLILSGSFAPGECINKNKLASELGTSRAPIREAIRTLEGPGLIVSLRNCGSFIRRLSVQEVRKVYEIRSALFGLAGKLLAERVTADQLQRLNRFVVETEEASSQRNFEAYYPLNLAFHEFMWILLETRWSRSNTEASSRSCTFSVVAVLFRVVGWLFRTRNTVR